MGGAWLGKLGELAKELVLLAFTPVAEAMGLPLLAFIPIAKAQGLPLVELVEALKLATPFIEGPVLLKSLIIVVTTKTN